MLAQTFMLSTNLIATGWDVAIFNDEVQRNVPSLPHYKDSLGCIGDFQDICIRRFAFAYFLSSIIQPFYPTLCFELSLNTRALHIFCFNGVYSKNTASLPKITVRKEHMAYLKYKLKMDILGVLFSENCTCKLCSLDVEVDTGVKLCHLSVSFPIVFHGL